MNKNLLLTFAFLISSIALQANEENQCQSQHCLMVDNEYAIYMIDQGDNSTRLNNESAISSTLLASKLCYTGEISAICDILGAMAGVDERDYYLNGGHIRVNQLNCKEGQYQQIKVHLVLEHDFTPNQESIQRIIGRCQ
jgi:hypothetical protein